AGGGHQPSRRQTIEHRCNRFTTGPASAGPAHSDLLSVSLTVDGIQDDGSAPQPVEVLQDLAGALDIQPAPIRAVFVLQLERAIRAHMSDRDYWRTEVELRGENGLAKLVNIRLDDADFAVWLHLVPE